MYKFIVSALLMAMMTSTAFAKSSKNSAGKVNYNAIKVSFDAKYYYQLSYANRLKYLQEIQSLMLIVNKEKGIKGSAWIDLLINSAEAAGKTCFNGGLSYTVSGKDCFPLPESMNIDSSLSSCGSGQTRCSLAFGLGANNQALCYPTEKFNSATTICDDASNTQKSLERLNAELTKCEGIENSRCSALRKGIETDTKSIEAACKNSKASHCVKTKKKIEGLGKPGSSGEVVRNDDGCAAAEASVYQDLLASKLGTDKINKKWLKMVSLSSQACPGSGNLEQQLKKYGACTLPDSSTNVDGDIAADQDLNDAIYTIMNPGVRSGNTQTSNAFKKYFGVSPTEFKQVFCGSNDTGDFYEAVKKLGGVQTSDSKVTDRNMYGFLLNDKKVFDAHRGSMNSSLRDQIEKFYANKTKSEQLYNDWQTCSKAGASSCSDATAKRQAYESFSAANPTSALTMINAMFTERDPKKEAFNNSPAFKSGMGSGYAALKTAYTKDMELRDPSLANGGTAADRDQFKKCVENAIKKTEDGKNNKYESNYANNELYNDGKRNKNCTRELIDDLSKRSSDSSKLWFRYSNGNDSDVQNNKCYVSDGKIVPAGKNGLSGCSKAVLAKPQAGKERHICIDQVDAYGKPTGVNYTAYGFKCQNATGMPPVTNPDQAADAIIK